MKCEQELDKTKSERKKIKIKGQGTTERSGTKKRNADEPIFID